MCLTVVADAPVIQGAPAQLDAICIVTRAHIEHVPLSLERTKRPLDVEMTTFDEFS